MKVLIQRVRHANVIVENQMISSIQTGLLALVGIQPHDTIQTIEQMSQRLLKYRVFSDNDGKMNQSLLDIQGQLLLVSQFTLAADTQSGLRPSFSSAAAPAEAQRLFNVMVEYCQQIYPSRVEIGQFGANMEVTLCNDGPVTFLLQN